MKRLISSIALALVACLNPTVFAADAPSPDEVRKAVGRSLPYLEKEGLAWMRGRACVTCHQIPSMIWSLNEARRRKLAFDAAKVTLWNDWALANVLKKAVYYKLDDKSLEPLKELGISDSDLAKLQPLKNKNYVFENEFKEELTKQLTAEVSTKHEAALLKAAGKEKQGGGGGSESSQYLALLLAGAAEASSKPAEARQALIPGVLKAQNKDGSWPAGAQFYAQQRPAAESTEMATLWTVLALAETPEPPADAVKAVAKAREWLKNAKPAVSTEALMLRAKLAKKDGDKEKTQELLDKLLKAQHDDGGWGFLLDRPTSDPLTTGQVLYGLRYLGRGAADPAVQKAQHYLLKTQGADGVWTQLRNVISTSKKADSKDGDYIYTYWATGWAVIGLLETMD